MILAGGLANAAEVKRFETEPEAAANLRHPGVASIYEIGVYVGQHCCSMEYVVGRDLSAVFGGQAIRRETGAEWMRDIAEIVEERVRSGLDLIRREPTACSCAIFTSTDSAALS